MREPWTLPVSHELKGGYEVESSKKLNTCGFIMNLIEMLTSPLTNLLNRRFAVWATRNKSYVILAYSQANSNATTGDQNGGKIF